MSGMASMSRAIRLEIEKHGGTLKDVPDEALADYIAIAQAFVLDMKDEADRRVRERQRGGEE